MVQAIRCPLDRANSLSLEKQERLQFDTTKIVFPELVVKEVNKDVLKPVPIYDKMTCTQVSTRYVVPQNILTDCIGLNLVYFQNGQLSALRN